MTQASFSNGAYTLQNVHFPNLYMTDIGPSNVGGNPVVVGLPQDADTTVWDITWFEGSPNNGGNWTIMSGQTCDILKPLANISRWDIWPQPGGSIQISVHNTLLNLGLFTSTLGSSVELLSTTQVASPDQLFWTYSSINFSHNCM